MRSKSKKIRTSSSKKTSKSSRWGKNIRSSSSLHDGDVREDNEDVNVQDHLTSHNIYSSDTRNETRDHDNAENNSGNDNDAIENDITAADGGELTSREKILDLLLTLSITAFLSFVASLCAFWTTENAVIDVGFLLVGNAHFFAIFMLLLIVPFFALHLNGRLLPFEERIRAATKDPRTGFVPDYLAQKHVTGALICFQYWIIVSAIYFVGLSMLIDRRAITQLYWTWLIPLFPYFLLKKVFRSNRIKVSGERSDNESDISNESAENEHDVAGDEIRAAGSDERPPHLDDTVAEVTVESRDTDFHADNHESGSLNAVAGISEDNNVLASAVVHVDSDERIQQDGEHDTTMTDDNQNIDPSQSNDGEITNQNVHSELAEKFEEEDEEKLDLQIAARISRILIAFILMILTTMMIFLIWALIVAYKAEEVEDWERKWTERYNADLEGLKMSLKEKRMMTAANATAENYNNKNSWRVYEKAAGNTDESAANKHKADQRAEMKRKKLEQGYYLYQARKVFNATDGGLAVVAEEVPRGTVIQKSFRQLEEDLDHKTVGYSNSHLFMGDRTAISFDKANEFCKTFGHKHLAAICGEDQWKAVQKLVKWHFGKKDVPFWIGLNAVGVSNANELVTEKVVKRWNYVGKYDECYYGDFHEQLNPVKIASDNGEPKTIASASSMDATISVKSHCTSAVAEASNERSSGLMIPRPCNGEQFSTRTSLDIALPRSVGDVEFFVCGRCDMNFDRACQLELSSGVNNEYYTDKLRLDVFIKVIHLPTMIFFALIFHFLRGFSDATAKGGRVNSRKGCFNGNDDDEFSSSAIIFERLRLRNRRNVRGTSQSRAGSRNATPLGTSTIGNRTAGIIYPGRARSPDEASPVAFGLVLDTTTPNGITGVNVFVGTPLSPIQQHRMNLPHRDPDGNALDGNAMVEEVVDGNTGLTIETNLEPVDAGGPGNPNISTSEIPLTQSRSNNATPTSISPSRRYSITVNPGTPTVFGAGSGVVMGRPTTGT